MSVPEVTEEPRHHMSSLLVRGKIFVTVPSDQDYIHVFITEPERDLALAIYEGFTEALYSGSKLVGDPS